MAVRTRSRLFFHRRVQQPHHRHARQTSGGDVHFDDHRTDASMTDDRGRRYAREHARRKSKV
jgi:hypothetical protein